MTAWAYIVIRERDGARNLWHSGTVEAADEAGARAEARRAFRSLTGLDLEEANRLASPAARYEVCLTGQLAGRKTVVDGRVGV